MDYPIVFIPGLFGSLGDDIIPGTGKFSFGLAEDIYRPFIQILNSMGYVEGRDLFICYYDWRKSVLEAVDKYLFAYIEKVKMETGKNKVILIGHSLGGLLGRAYVNYFYPSSIDKLIMIGTPNLGSINAYYFWSGGELPYPKVENDMLYNALKLGFILYYKLFHKIDYIEAVRQVFPVARDLLPSYEYGDYLISEEYGIIEEIPIEDMSINNLFLNSMINKYINKINTFIISGNGTKTNNKFMVDIKNIEKDKWADGKPIKTYKTIEGDGTVTTFSTLGNLYANNIVLEGNHTNILYKSKDYLSSILGKPIVKDVEIEKVEKVYIVFAKDCEKINIKTSKSNEISRDEIDIVDSRVKAINLMENDFWIMVSGEKDLEIKVNKKGTSNSKVHMGIIK